MTPQRWARMKEIFGAALEESASARPSFLDSACDGDAELRAEVERLLAECDDTSLHSPARKQLSEMESGDTAILSAGSHLGPYEIIEPIGSGGMGEVWKARDPRLGRIVAIKISKSQFSNRFEREARVIAALNHPHICQIYDVGPNYLVMEYVEGVPLKGPIPFDRTLGFAIQLAGALDAAHRNGIVHRDLKPGNVMMTKSGVKVLDFGLAKMERASDTDLMQTMTREGAILGTLLYMSPEQLQGKKADARTDIFSFGCILYEMLTGKLAFDGADTPSVIAAILEREAPSVAKVAPPALDRLLARCLAKDRDERWQSALDIKKQLEWIAAGGTEAVESRRTSRVAIPWMAAGTLAMLLAAGAFVHYREKPAETVPLVRFDITPPENTRFHSYDDGFVSSVISPDGKRVAFAADGADGRVQIWLRSLDSIAAQPLAGTENASRGCWSPDGKTLAFFASGKLKRVDLAGGGAFTLADKAPSPKGCAWNQDGVILFGPDEQGPLYRVAASGGAASPLTKLDVKAGEIAHRFPWFLPDGKHFLYTAVRTGAERVTIRISAVGSSGDGVASPVIEEADSSASYALGYLLFIRGNALMARPFDSERLAFTGDAVPAAEGVLVSHLVRGYGAFSVSTNGWLIYQRSGEGNLQLTWYDRAGKRVGTLGDPGNLSYLHLSPDQKSAAVTIADSASAGSVWIYDVFRGLRTRFTTHRSQNRDGIWSPDGKTILFFSERTGSYGIFRKSADSSGSEEFLYADDQLKRFPHFSPDGKYLAYDSVGDLKNGIEIWVLPNPLGPAGASKPFSFVRTGFHAMHPRFSPDGKWLAYQSRESGRNEIYAAPFPGPGGKRQISPSGGGQPRWRQDGKELFYYGPGQKVMAASLTTRSGILEVGKVEPLFGLLNPQSFDVSADGQRFLAIVPPEHPSVEPLTVVQNWTAGLRK